MCSPVVTATTSIFQTARNVLPPLLKGSTRQLQEKPCHRIVKSAVQVRLQQQNHTDSAAVVREVKLVLDLNECTKKPQGSRGATAKTLLQEMQEVGALFHHHLPENGFTLTVMGLVMQMVPFPFSS